MSMTASLRVHDNITIHADESADLLEVATAVKDLRDKGKAASNAHHRALKEIQADGNLTAQGKEQQTAEATTQHRANQRVLIEQEKKVINDKISALERRLDGHIGYSQTDIIAFRDAQDRAEAIETGERASKVMARALRANDRTLAHALFRAALENGWKDAAQQFAAENPSIATVAHDVRKLTQLLGGFGRAIAYM